MVSERQGIAEKRLVIQVLLEVPVAMAAMAEQAVRVVMEARRGSYSQQTQAAVALTVMAAMAAQLVMAVAAVQVLPARVVSTALLREGMAAVAHPAVMAALVAQVV